MSGVVDGIRRAIHGRRARRAATRAERALKRKQAGPCVTSTGARAEEAVARTDRVGRSVAAAACDDWSAPTQNAQSEIAHPRTASRTGSGSSSSCGSASGRFGSFTRSAKAA